MDVENRIKAVAFRSRLDFHNSRALKIPTFQLCIQTAKVSQQNVDS